MSVLCELTAVTNWRTAVDPVRITPGRVVSLSGTLDGETALLGQNFFNVVSDGLKAELQQSSTHPKGWSAPFRASGRVVPLNGTLNGETVLLGHTFLKAV